MRTARVIGIEFALALVVCAGCFGAGVVLGGALREPVPPVRAPQCPEVKGQRVVSTVDDHGTQFCNYANAYGMAITRRKL